MQQVINAMMPFIVFVIVIWGASEIIMALIPSKKQRRKNKQARQRKKAERAESSRQAALRAERDKMSDELRYDVLHRDGFRCVRCGATAQDGVKLHVDHIVPISRAGERKYRTYRRFASAATWARVIVIRNSDYVGHRAWLTGL